MANIRRDEAQLIITINAKESAEYQKVLSGTAKGVQDIKKLTAGTEEYNAALNEQAAISRKLASTDYTKLSIKQIQDRRSQLVQLQRTLPGVTFAEAGFERELKQVNTALAENAARTRAVSTAMKESAPAVSGFAANFKKGLAFFAPLGIVEGIKQIGSSLIGLARDSVTAFDSAAKAEAQLEAAIKSTGGAAGKSVEELVKQSAELQKITLFSDDQIQEAQGLLLTFTKVGGEIYDQAIPAITDMATAMNTDLNTASIQVGKALNDPVKGVTALTKAGVQFTDSQKATIKSLVQTGDVAGAQAVILKELETQFKGSAEAAANAGLGPFQKFQNRIDDIKEGIGLLITNGLGFLGPVLDKVATFAEKYVGVLVSGESATGEFSGAVNFLVGLLRIVYNTVEGVVESIGRWISFQIKIFNLLKELPVIGGIIRAFAATFNFIVDAVSNTAAVFAGLKAAIQQTFDNASDYIKSTLISLKIFAKEAELLFTINGRDQVKAEIKQLESLKADYAKAGKTVGQAYADAYKAVITKEAKAADLVSKITKPVVGAGGNTGGGSNTQNSKKPKATKDTIGIEDFNIYDPAIYQAALDFRLKQLSDAAAREQAILKESYLQGKISLEQYEVEKLRISSSSFSTQIALLDAYGQKESDKRREINIMLLETDKALIAERAAQISELENAQLTELESQFVNRLITEEEYNLSRLRIQLNFYNEQLRLLEENGLTETDVYRKIQEEKLKTQLDYNKQQEDNERRTAQIKEQIQREGISVAQDLFALGVELLSQDEKARKKNASAIKRFETASILINSLAEIAEINRQYAKLGPIGSIIGVAKSVATAVRAGIAIAKVNAQQFYRGGKIRTVSGQLIAETPNINPLAGGDNVLIAAKPGEVVLNKSQQERAGGAEFFRSLGVPGFYGGGIIPSLPNTTPTIRPQVLSRNPVMSQSDRRIDQMISAIEYLTDALPKAIRNMNLKTHVVYNDIEKTKSTIDEIKRISSF